MLASSSASPETTLPAFSTFPEATLPASSSVSLEGTVSIFAPTSTASSANTSIPAPPVPQPPPLRRSTRTRHPNPKFFGDKYVNLTTAHPIPPTLEPSTGTQALKDSRWRKEIEDQFTALIRNDT